MRQFVFWLRMVLMSVLKGSPGLGVHVLSLARRTRLITSSALVLVFLVVFVRVTHHFLGFHLWLR